LININPTKSFLRCLEPDLKYSCCVLKNLIRKYQKVKGSLSFVLILNTCQKVANPGASYFGKQDTVYQFSKDTGLTMIPQEF
jgi:hypothetical protein